MSDLGLILGWVLIVVFGCLGTGVWFGWIRGWAASGRPHAQGRYRYRGWD